jgi:hypothetical protein
MWRGRTWRGRAGQAFMLGEPGVTEGPPPIRSSRATADRDRMAGSSRRSSSQGTACGSRTRAWGQREPPHERTGRLKKARQDGRACSRVGWTSFLLTPGATHFAWSARSGRSRAAFGHALGDSALLGLLHIAISSSNPLLVVLQPIEQGPGRSPVRVRLICRRPKPKRVLITNGRDS